eukprot:TRINITY_DN323_c0_g1_i3.p1 TRINITY_DN323_c0_g1~~TRINITY_DN323_c0_g1_i3.p1  ORF type:complete len:126 (-),score=14.64 TRINITY_DN323_c0_g1_i3:131-508(-)
MRMTRSSSSSSKIRALLVLFLFVSFFRFVFRGIRDRHPVLSLLKLPLPEACSSSSSFSSLPFLLRLINLITSPPPFFRPAIEHSNVAYIFDCLPEHSHPCIPSFVGAAELLLLNACSVVGVLLLR